MRSAQNKKQTRRYGKTMNYAPGQLDEYLKEKEPVKRSSLDDETIDTGKRTVKRDNRHRRHSDSGAYHRHHHSGRMAHDHSHRRSEEESFDECVFPYRTRSTEERDSKTGATALPQQVARSNANEARLEERNLGVKGVVIMEDQEFNDQNMVSSSREQVAFTPLVEIGASGMSMQGHRNDECHHRATNPSGQGRHNGGRVPGAANSRMQDHHMDDRVPGPVVVPGFNEEVFSIHEDQYHAYDSQHSDDRRSESQVNSSHAITARVVDSEVEHWALREQIQQVLREEPEHANLSVVHTATIGRRVEHGNAALVRAAANDSDGDEERGNMTVGQAPTINIHSNAEQAPAINMDPPKSGGFWHGTRGRLVTAALILVIVATAVGVTMALVLSEEQRQSDELNTDNATAPTPGLTMEPTWQSATQNPIPMPTFDRPSVPTIESTTEPTLQTVTPKPTPESTTDPAPSSTSATNDYPPIPLAYCNSRTEPLAVKSEVDKYVCGGDSFEVSLDPNPADVVRVDILLHSPEAAGFSVHASLRDAALIEIAGEIGMTNDRDSLLQVEANSQLGSCGVPIILQILGKGNCGLYNLTVSTYERVNFNMAGIGFDNARVIELDDGVTPYSSCGSINEVTNCSTAHYWTLEVNEGDEVYVNSLVESDYGWAYWTFFDESRAELNSSSSDGPISGRLNVTAKFIATTTGTHYIRLDHDIGAIKFYAVAFQVNRYH